MRINRIKLEGFRGARDPVEIPCGQAFTIVCGRNGSGKSTVCDALEFVLLGSLERFAAATERGEGISQYLWWRGEPPAQSHSVEIEFLYLDDQTFSVTRTPRGLTGENLTKYLVAEDQAPDDWRTRICRTSVVRDETITSLSTDQPERERFDFALQAIGLASTVAIEKRLAQMLDLLRPRSNEETVRYQRTRERVELYTGELGRARAEASHASGESLDRLRRHYAEQLRNRLPDPEELSRLVAADIAALRGRSEALRTLLDSKLRLDARAAQLTAEETDMRFGDLRRKLLDEEPKLKEAKAAKDALRHALSEQRAGEPKLTALATLIANGAQVGLQEGRCPLCGSRISPTEFDSHIRKIEGDIRLSNRAIEDVVRKATDADRLYEELRGELESLQAEIADKARSKKELEEQQSRLEEEARALETSFDEVTIAAEIDKVVKEAAVRTSDLAVVEAYLSAHRVAELEEALKAAELAAEQSARAMQKLEKSRHTITEIRDAARQVTTEIVGERLEALRPLFVEFYQRLRPNAEWKEIDFLLRGDVRAFLSLSIGQRLNPRFVFSSGQRRALGLAFLLAIHLSRPWCNLETIILDDPVQHVDDYRALHLVETLSAMRQSGRQVICTVEDPALADLLCRRLRAEPEAEGMRVDLEYVAGGGIRVSGIHVVEPLPRRVFAAS